ncbi:MAG: hypothetical protein IKQ49_05015 [Eubacterium sp.]|nr:hypothetical protein [Eubacterium sp.]
MAKTKEQKKALKELNLKKKRKKVSKWVIYLILAVILIAGAYLTYYLIRYNFYNHYRDYVKSYTYNEEVQDFKAISDDSPSVEGYKLAAEGDTLKLYVQTETGNIAVYDKRNGETVYSNPPGADTDGIANNVNKNYMKSQLIIDYYNTQRIENTFDSCSQAVAYGQMEMKTIENGVRVIFTFGDTTASTGIVPIYIRQETLDNILAQLDPQDAKYAKKKFVQSDKGDDILVMLENTQKGVAELRRLNEYFTQAGFTKEDYEREMENADVEDAVPITFTVPIDYTIKDDYLEATVYMKGVKENGGGAIHDIQMLNYFGAAGKDEQGYMLVPNGTGSLIYFNNGKGRIRSGNDYSEYIYGLDPMVADYTVREITQNAKLSLYGIFREKSAILATIESGASLANVSAQISGDVNEYNNVYTTFTVRGNDTLSMFGTTGSEADLPIVETNYYDVPLTMRYTFLTEDKASYSAAAGYYRDRLISEGRLKAGNEETGNIKLYYDVISGLEETKYFLGTQYRGLAAMTTFEDAGKIAEDLADKGVTNQVMNLQGWSGGGYYHDTLGKIKVPGKLGGKSDLEDLSKKLSSMGGTVYVDCAFQKVSEVSSRYSVGNESSRYYGTGYVGEFGEVSPVTLRQTASFGYDENIYYLISPKFLVRYTESFADKIRDYDIGGISLRDLGSVLQSDKRRTNVINREAALQVVLAQFQKMMDTGKKIMVNDGNDYSFAYANDIINAPLSDNDYYAIDESVPFYQMLIHGCIDYSGSAINLGNTTDTNEIVLTLVETGASPHFIFTGDKATEMKMTGLNKFYSTTYDSWKDTAVEIWKKTNEALSKVSGAKMTEFKNVQAGVSVTTYSNGVKIYVNHTDESVSVDGVSVQPKSYVIGG